MKFVNTSISGLATVLLCGAMSYSLSVVQAASSTYVAIPHSIVATAIGTGVVKATLACGTERYAHAVLGDSVEASCLVLEDEKGQRYVVELGASQVFEDLEPRIADVDKDGFNDVVVVRSDAQLGAALVAYQLAGDSAKELFATPAIGRAYRWLAPIGIADFNSDGMPDIAYVQTPHIGGILKIWSFIKGDFQQIAEKSGYSNHSIGSSRVSTAKIVDHNNDGVVDIALPDQYRGQTVWLSLSPDLKPAFVNSDRQLLEPLVIDQQPYDETYFD